MKESRESKLRKTLKHAFRLQETLVEHKDAGTPTHGVNEALGDIFRELTNPDPAESYIQSKVNLLNRFVREQEQRPLNEPYEYSMRKYATNPEVQDKTKRYLRRNKLFRKEISKLSLPNDRREMMLDLADAQHFAAEGTLYNEGQHDPLLDKRLRNVIAEVENHAIDRKVKRV